MRPRADELLPLQAAAVAPPEPNGYKLERFVFDLLRRRSVMLVEALREDEYSPVKNAHGSESPASARSALDACMRLWLTNPGWTLPPPPCWIDGPEDAASLTVRDARAAGSGVRVGAGVSQ